MTSQKIGLTARAALLLGSAVVPGLAAPAVARSGDEAAVEETAAEASENYDDVQIIVDPVSKIAYEFCIYRQKRQVRYEVNLAWGKRIVAPRHAGALLG